MKWVSDVDEVGGSASLTGWGGGTSGKGKTRAGGVKEALTVGQHSLVFYDFGSRPLGKLCGKSRTFPTRMCNALLGFSSCAVLGHVLVPRLLHGQRLPQNLRPGSNYKAGLPDLPLHMVEEALGNHFSSLGPQTLQFRHHLFNPTRHLY